MITIPHIQGVISAKDLKKVPKKFVAKHSTGNNWLFFETTQEYEDYKELHFPKPTPEEEI